MKETTTMTPDSETMSVTQALAHLIELVELTGRSDPRTLQALDILRAFDPHGAQKRAIAARWARKGAREAQSKKMKRIYRAAKGKSE
jgi:hypothetical protein